MRWTFFLVALLAACAEPSPDLDAGGSSEDAGAPDVDAAGDPDSGSPDAGGGLTDGSSGGTDSGAGTGALVTMTAVDVPECQQLDGLTADADHLYFGCIDASGDVRILQIDRDLVGRRILWDSFASAFVDSLATDAGHLFVGTGSFTSPYGELYRIDTSDPSMVDYALLPDGRGSAQMVVIPANASRPSTAVVLDGGRFRVTWSPPSAASGIMDLSSYRQVYYPRLDTIVVTAFCATGGRIAVMPFSSDEPCTKTLAADDRYVYWATEEGSSSSPVSNLRRGYLAAFEGGSPEIVTLTALEAPPRVLQSDGAYVYWTDSRGIVRMPREGGAVQIVVAESDPGYVYPTFDLDATDVMFVAHGRIYTYGWGGRRFGWADLPP